MSETYVVGVDLGGTQIRAVLANERGEFLDRRELHTQADHGLEWVLDRIVDVVGELTAEVPGVGAIGVGAPGPINSKLGVVSNPPNLPGWVNVPLGRLVQDHTGVLTSLGNDANVAALGEFTFGAGRDVQHLIYITVSTGVGGGIITDGELLEGHRGAAGEVGHIIVVPGGPRCNCGGYGHLEALASGTAIGRQAREAVAAGRKSLVSELAAGRSSEITASVVTEAAAQGDELSVELLRTAGTYLGYGMVSLVHLFNPEMIAVGGGVSRSGDLLLDPAREVVEAGLLPVFKEDLRIVPTSLGGDVGLKGAVALALRAVAGS